MDTIIDAHHHLWDPGRRAYAWLDEPALVSIRRAFTAEDLRARAAAAGVGGTIAVPASARDWPVRDIADLAQVSQRSVRQVIHDVNETGFAALNPQWSGGAPKTIDDTTRTRIRAIAGCDPRALRQPFSTWSLPKLRDYLIEQDTVAAISRQTLRQILRDDGVTWPTTKPRKASTDPESLPKMRRVFDRYD